MESLLTDKKIKQSWIDSKLKEFFLEFLVNEEALLKYEKNILSIIYEF